MVPSVHGLERSTNRANMEDVLDEVVSSEDLKVGENCFFFGVFNISAMNVLLPTQLQDFMLELCIGEH